MAEGACVGEKAKIDLWIKEIAPSHELRRWFSHDPSKWVEFKEKYRLELEGKKELLYKLKQLEKNFGTITLLYAAKDKQYNNAVALKNLLENL